MIKTIAVVLVVCATCWFAYIGIQQRYNVPLAQRIIAQKMEEFKAVGFDALAQKAGRGLLIEYPNAGGQSFPLKYTVEKIPGAAGSMVKSLKISGSVECIRLFPFPDVRTGPAFEMHLSQDLSYREDAGTGAEQH